MVALYQPGETIYIGRRPRGVWLRAGDWRNFLLRDDFTTDEAAPLASPRTAEPGPGTLTLVQTDGKFSISSAKLNFPAQASAAWGDQGFYDAVGRTRVAGLALVGQIISSTVNKAVLVGWKSAASLADSGFEGILQVGGGDTNLYGDRVSLNFGGFSLATSYQLAVVLRGTGNFAFIKGGAFTNWTLLGVLASGNTATLYPVFSNFSANGTLDTFRVLDLPAPFSTDYGLATDREAGSVSAGTTFTHEANCVIEWTQTTVPASGDTIVRFRYQDANNQWYVVVSSAGALSLVEVDAGSGSVRASAAAGISNGHRVVIVADGTTIRGYSNNVLRWTYSSASNFATETDGVLGALGTGGAVSDIIAWPRTLTGAAAAILDAGVA